MLGLFKPEYRGSFDHRMGWYVIVGSIPIGVVGLLAKDLITGACARSGWSPPRWSCGARVMLYAERVGQQDRGESSSTMRDAIIVGAVQCSR